MSDPAAWHGWMVNPGTRVVTQTDTDGYAEAQLQQARLTVTALIELESGNREAFIRTANELATGIGNFSYVNTQTKFTIASVNHGYILFPLLLCVSVF